MEFPTSPDLSRSTATGSDTDYTLSLEEIAERYERAGHPRTLRTLQRYCASGHLDARKVPTALGDKYLVTPQSVARHIAQTVELADADAARRGLSRLVATPVVTPVAAEQSPPVQPTPPAPEPDTSRHVASEEPVMPQYVTQLERENEQLRDDREFYRDQLKVKDGQIALKDQQIGAMLERDRETNILLQGLHKFLAPLLGSSRPAAGDEEGKPQL